MADALYEGPTYDRQAAGGGCDSRQICQVGTVYTILIGITIIIIIPLPRALEWAPFHPVREQGLPERDYPRWPKDVEKSVETSV